MEKKNQDSEDMFYGFWKYFGVVGMFLLGVVLTYWGIEILLNYWVGIRTALGPLGNIVIAPLPIGLSFVLFSSIEILRIIRE